MDDIFERTLKEAAPRGGAERKISYSFQFGAEPVRFVNRRADAVELMAQGFYCVLFPQLFALESGYYGLEKGREDLISIQDAEKELQDMEYKFRNGFPPSSPLYHKNPEAS